jgi:hypothetical protein
MEEELKEYNAYTNRLQTVPLLPHPSTKPKVQTHRTHPSLVDTVITVWSIYSIIRQFGSRTTLTLFVAFLVTFYPAVLISK